MSRLTVCFSMNSLMSMRTMAFSSSNSTSASALHSSVLPTPVGPQNMNEPIGRLGSCRPLRLRRTAFATARDRFVLADDALVQPLFEHEQLGPLAFEHAADTGTPVQALTTSAISSGPTSWRSSRRPCRWPSAAARRRPAWRLRLRRAASASFLRFDVELVQLLVQLPRRRSPGDCCSLIVAASCSYFVRRLRCSCSRTLGDVAHAQLFGFPLLAEARPACLRSSAISSLISASRSLACSSVSSSSCRAASSSCMSRRCSLSISVGHAFQLHRQPAGGLVHQVDRLVRQEAVGDVAVRQLGRGDERGVLDLHALVMRFVARLEPAEDGDRVLDVRLADEHRLEPPLQGRVLLDVLAVLVERRGADAAQLAAGERRLEQVGRVVAAFGRAGADDRVQLVDEQDDVARRPALP